MQIYSKNDWNDFSFYEICSMWHAPKLFDRLKCEYEVKTMEE
jgi:hypothetical protein